MKNIAVQPDLDSSKKERGAGTLYIAGAIFAIVMAGLVSGWIVGWLGCAQRANAVADLAAISAAKAKAAGKKPCPFANRTAAANNAKVTSCRILGNDYQFDVTVTVTVQLFPAIKLGPKTIAGTSTAGTITP